jgi:hypothetical protein
MATTTKKLRLGAHSICRSCDLGFVKKDGACAICGDTAGVYRCGGPGKCACCTNKWPRWTEEPEEPQQPQPGEGMTFKARVIQGGKLVLENGARLAFDADDCEEPLAPGDRVILDTGRTPSIRKSKSEIYTPVAETKAALISASKETT